MRMRRWTEEGWWRRVKWSIPMYYCGESLTNIFSRGVSLFYWCRSYTEHELLKVVERENLIISPLPLVWAGLLFLFCKTWNALSSGFVCVVLSWNKWPLMKLALHRQQHHRQHPPPNRTIDGRFINTCFYYRLLFIYNRF